MDSTAFETKNTHSNVTGAFPQMARSTDPQAYQGRTLELLAAVQRVAILEQANIVLQGTWKKYIL